MLRFGLGHESAPCPIPPPARNPVPAFRSSYCAHDTGDGRHPGPNVPAVTRSGRGGGRNPEGWRTANGSGGSPMEERSRRNFRAQRGSSMRASKKVGDLPEGQRHLVKVPLEGRTQAIARIDRRDTRFDSLPKWGIGISKAITVGLGGIVPAAVRITTGTGGGPAPAFGVVRRISRSGPASCEARNGFPGRQPKQPGRIPCRPIPPPDVSHHAFGDLPQPESVHGFG